MQLTYERLHQVLSYDWVTGKFTRNITTSTKHKAGCEAGGINAIGYVAISIDHKLYLGHRLAWFYFYGENPDFDVDHINGNRLDNRICNLRLATMQENSLNRDKQKNNSSGYKNVSWSKAMKRWMVRMQVKGKDRVLGYYSTPEEANVAAIQERKMTQSEFGLEYREVYYGRS